MPDARMLIIDDELGIVRLCTRLLEQAGYEVNSTTDPRVGVDLLSTDHFDGLLVDIRMPGMDGFEVIAHARKHQPEIAVVIMTGFGTLETAILALRQGADGLILKPFKETNELVDRVQEALLERQRKREMARLRAIRPLLELTETLFSETRYDALLALIVNAITTHIRCQHAGIYRRDKNTKLLEVLIGHGELLPEEESSSNAGLVGRADHWDSGIWVNLEGPGNPNLQGLVQEYNFSSVLCIPVRRDDYSLVFFAGRGREEPVFQLADLDMFGILARQADSALENARLYGELREYIRQLEDSQRALIQAEKMAAVGRLTASIAHEVNNPLQSVRNCLHLVGREELEEEVRASYLALAEDELERLLFTVQRMLDFYRPGALERESVHLHTLLEKVLALLKRQLAGQNIVVQVDVSEELPLLYVVGNQIQQVFWNLILNAMDAMPTGGELTISAKVNDNKEYVEITFEDTGSGIPSEERERIFEPFVSSKEDGTGLGLSVSYGILTAHGGDLALVKGRNNTGACFLVSLPISEAK